jgi:hypothetical protein
MSVSGVSEKAPIPKVPKLPPKVEYELSYRYNEAILKKE